MKRPQRISRRVIRRFLQTTALALACGVDFPAALAAGGPSPSYSPPASSRSQARGKVRPHKVAARYRHEFTLAEADAEYPARVKVTTTDGKPVLQGIVHAPGRLGPLTHGAYAVAIRTPSGDDVQLVRIGPDTDAYLSFLAPPEEA